MNFYRRIGVALLALGVVAAPAVHATYQELDAIVAIVEDDVVLASELMNRMEMVQEQIAASNIQAPPTDVLLSQIMERLILESLQAQEADRRGVQVDDETLTDAVLSFAQQNNMSLTQFQEALREDGVSYPEFREQIRREMLITRLQRNLVSRRIAISDKDIDDLLNSPYYQQMLSDEYRVGHILLTVDEDSGDGARVAAERDAAEIVRELRAGADFRQMAIARSSGSRALEGGDLGWRKAGELPSLFTTEVLELAVGETADPISTRGGIHIVQLLEMRGASTERESQAQVRHILVQPSRIRTDEQARERLEEVVRKLADGEDFAQLARQYSEDPGSALNGGDLGWTSGNEFVAEFREALAATPTGELSAPFQSQYGWHILQVQDRREQDMSDEARRSMALRILHQRRFDEELQDWLSELRDEAFVEVRL